MLNKLELLVDDMHAIQNKIVLIVGAPQTGKTALLKMLAKSLDTIPVNLGVVMGKRLSAIPQRQRPLEASSILRELADQYTKNDLLLIDNIELLFDHTLQLTPIDLLKRHAQARRIVAVWPGELRDGRLTYAELGHPEYQEYNTDGVVPFIIQ